MLTRGSKQYELTDHLGNIRTVVPDIKEPQPEPSQTANYLTDNDNFRLPTLTLNNYYPYGMLQAGRSRNAGGYRFGYQGQEADNKIGGLGQHTTAQFWEYDTWAVKRWNVDPKRVHWESPYSVFRNNPIKYNDINGDCPDCLDGKYTIQKGDSAPKLEGNWGMKKGQLSSYNEGVDLNNLSVGQTINVSPTSTSLVTIDDANPSITLYAGKGSIPQFQFDNGFSYDVNAKATFKDYWDWNTWNLIGNGSAFLLPEGSKAYIHFLHGKGTDKTFSFNDYLIQDDNAWNTIINLNALLMNELPKILPYEGSRYFNTNALNAGYDSNLFLYPKTEDWQKAIGSYQFWVTGKVTATDIQGQLVYSVSYTLHAVDKYNFNPGNKDIASGIPDNVNGRFSQLGWGQPYIHRGLFNHTFNFTK